MIDRVTMFGMFSMFGSVRRAGQGEVSVEVAGSLRN